MPNHATATLIGHLGKDPETRLTQGGTKVTSFSIGVSTGFKDKKVTTWWKATAFGKTAEIAETYLKKGNPVLVEGEPFMEEWEKDGNKHSMLKLNVNRITLLGEKKAADNPTNAPTNDDAPFDDGIPF